MHRSESDGQPMDPELFLRSEAEATRVHDAVPVMAAHLAELADSAPVLLVNGSEGADIAAAAATADRCVSQLVLLGGDGGMSQADESCVARSSFDMAPWRCHTVTVEKRKPHHDLSAFREAFSTPNSLRMTRTAWRDAQALGFTRAMIVEVIQSMKREHFYKSMTAVAEYSYWQDVYHVPWATMVLYVKFTSDRVTEFLLLSFKEK